MRRVLTSRQRVLCVIGLGLWLGLSPVVQAQALPRTITLSPPASASCTEEFEAVANTLEPGDTLILKGGLYSQSCRRLLSGLQGTAAQPITIRAAAKAPDERDRRGTTGAARGSAVPDDTPPTAPVTVATDP